MTVNILGTDYEILYQTEQENPKFKSCDCSGLTETQSKKICILTGYENEPQTLDEIEKFKSKVLRHEIVHAFLHESGLDGCSDWATNEEIVDWIALQFPKMLKAFADADAANN